MSKYAELLNNPPKLNAKEGASEVVINLISCMCDNKYKWTIKKNDEGNFKIRTHGFAFRNFQTKFHKDEIEWEADDSNWDEVFRMINSGTSKIDNLKSR
jgi:hypothetical protein|tara:strand:- start:6266 stop:6562 length:297 start_codon:yes stop_codon:yes gene_type:complete